MMKTKTKLKLKNKSKRKSHCLTYCWTRNQPLTDFPGRPRKRWMDNVKVAVENRGSTVHRLLWNETTTSITQKIGLWPTCNAGTRYKGRDHSRLGLPNPEPCALLRTSLSTGFRCYALIDRWASNHDIVIDGADYFRFPKPVDACAQRLWHRPEVLPQRTAWSSTNDLQCTYNFIGRFIVQPCDES